VTGGPSPVRVPPEEANGGRHPGDRPGREHGEVTAGNGRHPAAGVLEQTRDAQVRAAALGERQHLAREMHDVLAHSLSGLVLQLEGARMLAAQSPADPRLGGVIDRAHHLAKTGLQEARWAIGMLRDEELPGPERLAALVEEFERDSGIPSTLTVTGQQRDLGSGTRLALSTGLPRRR
jgi:signal transduction histidine kinase